MVMWKSDGVQPAPEDDFPHRQRGAVACATDRVSAAAHSLGVVVAKTVWPCQQSMWDQQLDENS